MINLAKLTFPVQKTTQSAEYNVRKRTWNIISTRP